MCMYCILLQLRNNVEHSEQHQNTSQKWQYGCATWMYFFQYNDIFVYISYNLACVYLVFNILHLPKQRKINNITMTLTMTIKTLHFGT